MFCSSIQSIICGLGGLPDELKSLLFRPCAPIGLYNAQIAKFSLRKRHTPARDSQHFYLPKSAFLLDNMQRLARWMIPKSALPSQQGFRKCQHHRCGKIISLPSPRVIARCRLDYNNYIARPLKLGIFRTLEGEYQPIPLLHTRCDYDIQRCCLFCYTLPGT